MNPRKLEDSNHFAILPSDVIVFILHQLENVEDVISFMLTSKRHFSLFNSNKMAAYPVNIDVGLTRNDVRELSFSVVKRYLLKQQRLKPLVKALKIKLHEKENLFNKNSKSIDDQMEWIFSFSVVLVVAWEAILAALFINNNFVMSDESKAIFAFMLMFLAPGSVFFAANVLSHIKSKMHHRNDEQCGKRIVELTKASLAADHELAAVSEALQSKARLFTNNRVAQRETVIPYVRRLP